MAAKYCLTLFNVYRLRYTFEYIFFQFRSDLRRGTRSIYHYFSMSSARYYTLNNICLNPGRYPSLCGHPRKQGITTWHNGTHRPTEFSSRLLCWNQRPRGTSAGHDSKRKGNGKAFIEFFIALF